MDVLICKWTWNVTQDIIIQPNPLVIGLFVKFVEEIELQCDEDLPKNKKQLIIL